ncbi:MAG: FkbM family methyltransferase [Candidatus Symbiothrix sp.]|jgi:FkbM family methyltransferase|nr:FkbM family methyltransferase [Candidatus Symbiothrix sp.]
MIEKLRRKLFKNTTYRIDNYNILIPTSFKLPTYQKEFSLYDRFLPVLAKNLNVSDHTIIDVGANVGDTLVAMIQKCHNRFICIEPSDFFFTYLEKNTQNLIPEDAKRVILLKSLVGTGEFSGELKEINGSTASIVLSTTDKSNVEVTENRMTYNRLDDIVQHHSDIILLKSDVDGFDFDVIRSAEKIIEESEPILFFENHIDNDFQYIEFDKLYDFLKDKGYLNLYIFDNFGNIIVEKSDYHTLRNINEYVYRMKKYQVTRTFYYTDILVTSDKWLPIVDKAILDYKKNWLTK